MRGKPERQGERLQDDRLFKWFLDRNLTDPAFDATTFTKRCHHLHQESQSALDP